jgi:CheY-like chemotaxis protein
LPNRGKRILVVEDEADVANSLRMLLASIGHTAVEIAESAEQALKLAEDAKFDVIITDFALGKMTGIDLARAVKSKHPGQPFVLITAYAESLELGKVRLSDFVSVLGKPFSLEDLKQALALAFQS